jgi:hypothetical protein
MTGYGSEDRAYEEETKEAFCDCGNELMTDEEIKMRRCEECK